MNGDRQPNRLASETSPYLLQHSFNPVDWYPWGDEAFAEAKRRNVPIFLSIGYSSCHWCHVMEQESFEDDDTADYLNDNFVSIKLDREERPDIDHFYMEACSAMNTNGGWPLSCFLTHDRKPFYIGTYFPVKSNYGMPSFMDVLKAVTELWEKDRNRLTAVSESITDSINSSTHSARLSDQAVHTAFQELKENFDDEYGGFSHAPKFPSVHNLMFLMRYGTLYGNNEAFEMVHRTLDCISKGGILDQIGGGFSRYSTDRKWLIPHFEKMLYDNAMLIIAYSEASKTVSDAYIDVVHRTVGYVCREMRSEHGAFFTSQDADSEDEEGRFYLWRPDETINVLGEENGRKFNRIMGITGQGNFDGKSVPNLVDSEPSPDDLKFVHNCLPELYRYRSKRVAPNTDTKILTSANSLMIAALAIASRLLNEDSYIEPARQALDFMLKNSVVGGRLMSSWRNSVSTNPSSADDYAYLVWACYEMYQATMSTRYLSWAVNWAEEMLRLFEDREYGGLFMSGEDVSDLPVRHKSLTDGASLSGNSVAALVLKKLGRLTDNPHFAHAAEGIIRFASASINSYPLAYTGLLMSVLYENDGGTTVKIAEGNGTDKLLECLHQFNPFTSWAVIGDGYPDSHELIHGSFQPSGSAATAYICTDHTCLRPITDLQLLSDVLNKKKRS